MIIASPLLRLRQTEGDTDIAVRILAPQPSQSHWSCDYEIGWPEGTRKGTAHGFDSVQALLFALEMIGAEIYQKNLRGLLEGDDAKYL